MTLAIAARRSLRTALVGGIVCVALAACTVGPNYQRPAAAISTHFKEADGWRPAHPVDALDKGVWWSVFQDAELDALERRVEISNQTVAQAVAQYRQAHQITKEAQASFFPTVSADAEVRDQYSGGRGGGGITTTAGGATVVSSGGGNGGVTTYSGSLDATWAPDLWGRIRRTVESDRANAQAAAADIANAKLSEQALLATDYFGLRINDAQQALYRQTVSDFQKFQTLTQNQYAAGTQSRAAVISAQTQLLDAQATLVDLQTQRAEYEHAIAVLAGVAPSELSIAPIAQSRFEVPVAPADIPSTLLERRPDIAAAERLAAAANAQIGVQEAAFYPDITLTGSYGYASTGLGNLFNASNELWSVGGSLAETLIDFGSRRAAVRAARAAYDAEVASYRQTVLTAFQGVEDNLAALRTLQREAVVRDQAVAAANQAVQLDLNQYKAGLVDYTTVITAQATALADAQTVLQVQQQRLQASINLIQDLGGGWDARDLPRG
jgi:NodT family efflux transporter outer membrane factor (OMF) lipoprotein